MNTKQENHAKASSGWLALTRKVVEQGEGLQVLMERWNQIKEGIRAMQADHAGSAQTPLGA